MKIYPSLIASDLLNIEKTLQILDDLCDGYHIDVMDDHFVPNLTWGPSFVHAIIKKSMKPIHLHLMVDAPDKWLDRIPLRQDDLFIFHYEAMSSREKVFSLLKELKKRGYRAGIALNPQASCGLIFDFLPFLDHVLLMSVAPGFSGQKFIPSVLSKVPLLISERRCGGLSFSIGMDGGIGRDTIKTLAREGVEMVGVASALFSPPDLVKAFAELRSSSNL